MVHLQMKIVVNCFNFLKLIFKKNVGFEIKLLVLNFEINSLNLNPNQYQYLYKYSHWNGRLIGTG